MNKVELILKNQDGIKVVADVLDFPYRLNRNVFTTSQDKLKVLGGTFSTQVALAKSKNNNKFFLGKTQWNSLSKFYNIKHYEAVLYENGTEVLRGVFRLEEITQSEYLGTFFDNDIDWVDRLASRNLNELGYVNGVPTWLVPFDGAASFNIVNEQTNRQTDYICPTIIYNNTPITDYMSFTDDDIWGTFELPLAPTPVRLTSGKSFPNDFITQTGLFSERLGLTFEDFPLGVYYRNVIERCFAEIGMTVECSLFDEDWFNHLYIPYVGSGYKYNWKNLASVSANLIATVEDNISGGSYPQIDNTYEADIDVPNQKIIPAAGVQPWFQDIVLKLGAISTIGNDDTSTLVDKITAVNKFGNPNQYIAPVDGRYTIRINSAGANEYNNLLVETDAGFTVFEAYDIFDSYGSGDVNSVKTDPIADRAYAWDDHVLVIFRKNQTSEFVFETEQLLGQWVSGTNKDFTIQPSDVVAYLSPKRYLLYQLGVLTDEREAFGSPLSNFTETVTVNPSSIAHTVYTNTDFDKSAYSAGEMTVSVDLLKNERLEIAWVSIETFKGSTFYHPDQSLEVINDAALGTNQSIVGDCDYEITYDCGEYDLDIAANLPNMTCKEFIAQFIREFNLYINANNNTAQLLPQQSYYTPETYDITSRVISNNWNATPVSNIKNWTVGYNNDNDDRLLLDTISSCAVDVSSVNNYGNISVVNDNVYAENDINETSMFSATKFYQGKVQSVWYDSAVVTIPTSTDPESGYVLDKGFRFSFVVNQSYFLDFPSIQSEQSFVQDTVGVLEYNWNYRPRLLYHLGTTNTYLGISNDYQCIIDAPRSRNGDGVANTTFVREDKHWYKPTISAFDTENNNPYRTLRYDTATGLYNTYFENLVYLYNQSEVLTLTTSLRNIDWINMRGSKLIKYRDTLYRLMSISDYSPLDNRPCTIKLLKTI